MAAPAGGVWRVDGVVEALGGRSGLSGRRILVPGAAGGRDSFGDALSAAGADWQLHIYGGVGHSYTNPAIDSFGMPGFAYNAAADARSWRSMLNLFEEVF